MYNSYFGFREKPFKLVPNPDYLFLSKSHEIALAHLTYATEQGEGFAVITGEVGTGKTTLCRNYLESLEANTSSAYIFNPKLESAQLLASICQEFGVKTGATTIKELLDLLNSFLIEQNAAGNKVVVLIDEAQGLSIENLELIRMLSNLETTRSKLLQIILVGQPELGDQLDSHELRQLAQRISLNYNLSPLSAKETEAYIQHRLGIASQRRAALFTVNACRSAYHFSGGIPRLINIVCDRALLLAYSHNRPMVDRKIMRAAIRELLNRGQARSARRQWSLLLAGSMLIFVATIAIAVLIWRGRQADRPIPQAIPSGGIAVGKVPPVDQGSAAPATIPAGAAAKDAAEAVLSNKADDRIDTSAHALTAGAPSHTATTPTSAFSEQTGLEPPEHPAHQTASGQGLQPEAKPAQPAVNVNESPLPLAVAIDGLETLSSRKEAVHHLLTLWGQPRPNVDLIPHQLTDAQFIDLSARQYELRVYATQWNWNLVEQLNLPVILTLRHSASGENVFVALIRKNGDHLRLSAGKDTRPIETTTAAVEPYLSGQIYVFWKNVLGHDMLIGYGASERAVLGVQHLLRQIGYDGVLLSSDFDRPTREAVRSFQRKKGLNDDGLVGPLTKIMLLKEANADSMPRLVDGKRVDS